MDAQDRKALAIGLALLVVTLVTVALSLLVFLSVLSLKTPSILFLLLVLLVTCSTLLFVAVRADVLERFRFKRFVSHLDVMHEEDFLDYIARLLNRQGCKTTITQGCATGIEIIADKKGRQYATMAVRSSSPLSAKVVSMANSGAQKHGCERTMIVTNSLFSQQAEELAKECKIKLVDGPTLLSWAEQKARKPD